MLAASNSTTVESAPSSRESSRRDPTAGSQLNAGTGSSSAGAAKRPAKEKAELQKQAKERLEREKASVSGNSSSALKRIEIDADNEVELRRFLNAQAGNNAPSIRNLSTTSNTTATTTTTTTATSNQQQQMSTGQPLPTGFQPVPLGQPLPSRPSEFDDPAIASLLNELPPVSPTTELSEQMKRTVLENKEVHDDVRVDMDVDERDDHE